MTYECNEYRSFLKGILVERIQKNPSYSLRAFSRQIGMSASMLSEVLKGSKNLSIEKASIVANRLELPQLEESYFLGLVQLENTIDIKHREKILTRLQELAPNRKVRDLGIDHFLSIADWICVAGMALLSGHPKGLTSTQIAARLGVTKFEASEAMNRWVRLELLQVSDGTTYVRTTHDHLMMESKVPNEALRKFHKTMFEKAIQSLQDQTNREKYIGSETISIDPEKLDEVSELIEEAVTKILKLSQSSKNKTEVYNLGFQFFRITKKGKAK